VWLRALALSSRPKLGPASPTIVVSWFPCMWSVVWLIEKKVGVDHDGVSSLTRSRTLHSHPCLALTTFGYGKRQTRRAAEHQQRSSPHRHTREQSHSHPLLALPGARTLCPHDYRYCIRHGTRGCPPVSLRSLTLCPSHSKLSAGPRREGCRQAAGGCALRGPRHRGEHCAHAGCQA